VLHNHTDKFIAECQTVFFLDYICVFKAVIWF